MIQVPEGPEEPTDGQQSGLGRGEIELGRSSLKRGRESLDAGSNSEQFPRPPVNAAAAPANPIDKPSSGEANRDDRPRYSPKSSQGPTSSASATRATNHGAAGPTISNPTHSPQWPNTIDSSASRRRTNSPTGERKSGKGSPPQRPPRPNYVAPLADTPNGQSHISSISGQQTPQTQVPRLQYWENDFQTPSASRTGPPNANGAPTGLGGNMAAPSSGTATGNPRLAAPIITPSFRRSANLGPPPSARRGAAAYYLPPTYVTPIPEELPETVHRSHGSFASSHVIPSSWGSGPPSMYIGEDPGEGEEDEDVSVGEDGRESNGGDHDEASGLVRQASLGKRHKPALTTIKSSEMLRKDGPTLQGQPDAIDDQPRDVDNRTMRLTTRTLDGTAGGENLHRSRQHGEHALGGGTGLLDPSSSSDESLLKMSNASTIELAPAVDPRINQILGGLEKGGALKPRGAGVTVPSSTLPATADSSRLPRPPRGSMYSSGEQDSRNSLTSLPDLIRRATRLASVLDRGRTASRLGMVESDESGDGREKLPSPTIRRRSGSISDILASFPSPGLATPTGERPSPRWPTPFSSSGLARNKIISSLESPSTENFGRRHRRCCGLPLWVFILLCLIILLIVAAAVIIPVTLVVLPRKNNVGNPSHNQGSSATLCENNPPCANGGTNVLHAGSCRCVCADGYTGDRCTVIADVSCVTTDLTIEGSNFKNASVGSSIPRLLQAAQSNFSIPLDPFALMPLFGAAKLSCTSQNALVTLNVRSQRRNAPIFEANQIEDTLGPSPTTSITTPVIRPRSTSATNAPSPSADSSTPDPSGNAVTSNGLVFASPTQTAAPSGTTTSSPSSGPGSSSKGSPVDDRILDFARITVLYIFQSTNLNTAVLAQENIQMFLGKFSRSSFTVTGTIVVDFGNLSINLGNGTVVGGKGYS